MTFASNALATLATLAALARTVHADAADDAFKRGRELVKQGKQAEACAAFEESQRLDPALGTRFNIAQCDEKIGKLATALSIYRDLIAHDTNATRKATAVDLEGKLVHRVPKLVVQIDNKPAPASLAITANDTPLAADGFVDFGSYTVVARAPGFRDATATATVGEEGRVVIVALHLEPITLAPTPPTPPPPQIIVVQPHPIDEPAPHHGHKTASTIMIAGGSVAVIGGIVVGILARSKWSAATAVCGGSTMCDSPALTAQASALGSSARTRANVSTGLVVVGAAVAGVGIVLRF